MAAAHVGKWTEPLCLVEEVAGSEQHGFDERVFLQASGYSTFERRGAATSVWQVVESLTLCCQ